MGRVKRWRKMVAAWLVPEARALTALYRRRTGRQLDLHNPQTLNEKIQWLKLYDRKPEYQVYADKLAVRQPVAARIGEQYLIPLLRVYEHPRQMKEADLPAPPFIVKTNHDSSGGIIVRSAAELDFAQIQAFVQNNFRTNHYYNTREWQYKHIQKRILIERLLQDAEGSIPNDYKFNCFAGKVEFIYCSVDREGRNYRKIYSRDWQPTGMTWTDFGKADKKFAGPDIPPPKHLDKMIALAETLAAEFSYVRIDLYNVDGQIYFGEITQHHGGGFEEIIPYERDLHYGSLVQLPGSAG